jgi:RimJ/RimL family protein N-acetyltransferase
MVEIVDIQERYVPGFHAALDAVSREKRFLAWTEAPPIESTFDFIRSNISNGIPQVVALDGELVVGWCDIEPHPRATRRHVGTLGMGLLPAYRGKGIGTRLIKAALDRARSRGMEKVELEVFGTNEPAIALYRKMGFVEEGRRAKAVKIDDASLDCILMALFL